jgi:hypothetical protein
MGTLQRAVQFIVQSVQSTRGVAPGTRSIVLLITVLTFHERGRRSAGGGGHGVPIQWLYLNVEQGCKTVLRGLGHHHTWAFPMPNHPLLDHHKMRKASSPLVAHA